MLSNTARFRTHMSAIALLSSAKICGSATLFMRTFQSQQNEIAIQIGVLNRSIRAAKPNTIRIR